MKKIKLKLHEKTSRILQKRLSESRNTPGDHFDLLDGSKSSCKINPELADFDNKHLRNIQI